MKVILILKHTLLASPLGLNPHDAAEVEVGFVCVNRVFKRAFSGIHCVTVGFLLSDTAWYKSKVHCRVMITGFWQGLVRSPQG